MPAITPAGLTSTFAGLLGSVNVWPTHVALISCVTTVGETTVCELIVSDPLFVTGMVPDTRTGRLKVMVNVVVAAVSTTVTVPELGYCPLPSFLRFAR